MTEEGKPMPGHPQHARMHQEGSSSKNSQSGKSSKKDGKKTFWDKTKKFVKECRRVLKVTKKPDKDELMTIVKITGLGIIVIGLIGFLIFLGVEGILMVSS